VKILNFSAENFKRISVVQITPTGNLVQITGKNGQGKTSVLDGIWAVLEGADAIQAAPIRKGQDKAVMQLKLGGDKVELIATRTLRRRKEAAGFTNTLTVETADGFRAPSPQAMMDKLMGRITMDPLAFSRMKSKEQFDQLRVFVPDVDFDDIAARNKSDFTKRTEVNRDAKQARSAALSVQVPDSIDDTTQPVDEAALIEQLNGAANHNASITTRADRREAARKQVEANRATADRVEGELPDLIAGHEKVRDQDIASLREQIALLEKRIVERQERANSMITEAREITADHVKKAREAADDLEKTLNDAEPLPEPIDTEALTARITEARNTNAAIRLRDQRKRHEADAERLEGEALELTTAMAARDKTKADAIAAAKLPVEGLGFGDGMVTIDGLPFDQASDAQQLRTSIAIAIATAGPLKVIRVRDGSLLDDEGMKLLAQMADEADMQIWVEVVGNGEKVGFVLVDGHLADQPPTDDQPSGNLL